MMSETNRIKSIVVISAMSFEVDDTKTVRKLQFSVKLKRTKILGKEYYPLPITQAMLRQCPIEL